MINLGEIGVLLSLTGNVSSVIQGWIKQFYALNVAANASQRQLTGIKLAAGSMVLGGAILADMLHLTKLGDKYLAQISEMKNKNLTPAQISEAEETARRVASAVPQTTLTGNLKDWQDLLQVFGDPHHATQYLETMEKAQAMMTAGMQAVGHSTEGARDEVFKMAKALEDAGAATNPERFQKDISLMLQMAQASNYRTTGQDFLQMIQQSKTAALSYSDEYMTRYLPIYASTHGASKAGTAGMTFFQEMVGGVMKEKTAQYMMSLGLVDPSKVVRNRQGSIKGVLPGGVIGSDLAASNPYEWVQQVLLPHLKAHGITSATAIRDAIASLVPVRTAQDMIMEYATQQERRYQKDKGMADNAASLTRYAEANRTNPLMVRAALAHQWDRVETHLGVAISPTVTSALFKLMEGLKWLAEVMEKHPNATKLIMEIALGMGVLLTVIGAVAGMTIIVTVLGAAFTGVGLAIMAFGAILGAIGAAVWYYWDEVKQWPARLRAAWDFVAAAFTDWWNWTARVIPPALTAAWKVVEDTFQTCWNWLSSTLPAQITAAWNAVINAIEAQVNRVTGALSGIVSAITNFINGILGLAPHISTGTPGVTTPSPPGLAPSLPNLDQRIPNMNVHPLNPLHPSSLQMPAPPSTAQPTSITHVNLNLDGQTISSVVLKHFADGLAKQLGGTSLSDDRVTPRPFGASVSI